jgi:hypothetical protein
MIGIFESNSEPLPSTPRAPPPNVYNVFPLLTTSEKFLPQAIAVGFGIECIIFVGRNVCLSVCVV